MCSNTVSWVWTRVSIASYSNTVSRVRKRMCIASCINTVSWVRKHASTASCSNTVSWVRKHVSIASCSNTEASELPANQPNGFSQQNVTSSIPRERPKEYTAATLATQATAYLQRESWWIWNPSQPQRIISGLRETFIQRYIVERTNQAELRPEEKSEKAESCRENLCNEIQLKGP